MRGYLGLSMIGLLILALGVFPFSSQATTERIKGTPPPSFFRMEVQGFTNESGPFGFPLLVIHQGETYTLKILFTREDTNDTITIMVLSLQNNSYGIQDMSLPEGITYAINPYSLELATNATYSANLTIVVSPTTRVGNVTLGIRAEFYLSGGDGYYGPADTSRGFTLEIEQSVSATGGIDLGHLAIIGVVIAAIAIIGLTAVEYRRKKLSKTSQRPPQQMQ